ncbi:hypothetical protein RCL1_008402 [Eukaryota sp. TZLM3-RCL]
MLIEAQLLLLVLGLSLFGLLVAFFIARSVLGKSDDRIPQEMKKIGLAITEGANGYLSVQYRSIFRFGLVAGALLFAAWFFRESAGDHLSNWERALINSCAFLFGCLCSALSGYIGMWVSVRANLRTANAARHSLMSALVVCSRAGGFAGILVVALSLLGVGGSYGILWYIYHGTVSRLDDIAGLLVGYGFGASFVALFSQLGGGIYTKAADVGADLVGKVMNDIPEDSPKNPAVIADLVGDNVGDCAGRGADLFESTAAENIGAMLLAGFICSQAKIMNPAKFILFPLVVRGFGLIASIIGIFSIRNKNQEKFNLLSEQEPDPSKVLNRGFAVSSFFSLIAIWGCSYFLLHVEHAPRAWIHFGLCGTIGILCAYSFVLSTTYYTDYIYNPVKSIAQACKTGHATCAIQGVAVGFESALIPVLTIAFSVIGSYWLGRESGLVDDNGVKIAGVFGTACATMGMLANCAYILCMDVFGPIADNAGGIVEMSGAAEEVRARTDRLDAVGNSTKATTKGYAIGSAALAVYLLFKALLDEAANYAGLDPSEEIIISLNRPEVFIAGLLGGGLILLFSAWTIKAVGNAAQSIIYEVKRQFDELPGILSGTQDPQYDKCVAITTRAALKEMVAPGLLAVCTPVLVGLAFRLLGQFDGEIEDRLLGVQCAAAFLMIATAVGVLIATFLNNAGGAWDNAKKYVETEALGPEHGKYSETHKASVTGDVIGDPFKDTAGPSIHVLIKLLSTVLLVFCPLFIAPKI